MLRNPQPKKLYGWKAYERENENPTKKKVQEVSSILGTWNFLGDSMQTLQRLFLFRKLWSFFHEKLIGEGLRSNKRNTHTHTTLNRSSFSQQELEEKKHENLRILLKMFLRTLWASSMRNERLKKQPVPTWKKQKSDFENLEELKLLQS